MKKPNLKEVVDISTLPEVNTAISSIILNFKNNDRRLRLIESLFKFPDKILKIFSRDQIIEFAKEQKIFIDPNEGKKPNPKDPQIEKKLITPEELAKAAKGLIIDSSISYRKDKKTLFEQIETLKKQKEEAEAYWANPPPVDPKKKVDKKTIPPSPEEIIIPIIDEFDTEYLVVLYNYPLSKNEYDALDKENIILNNIFLVNEEEDYPDDKSYEEMLAAQPIEPKAKKPPQPKSASADLVKPLNDNTIIKYFGFPPNNMVSGYSPEELQNENFGDLVFKNLKNAKLNSDKISKLRLTIFDKDAFHFRMMDDPKKTYYTVYQDNFVEKMKKIFRFYLYFKIWEKNNNFQDLGSDPKVFTKKNVETLFSLSEFEPKNLEHLSVGNIIFSFFKIYDPNLILINEEEEEKKRKEEIRKKEEEEAAKKAKEEEEKRLIELAAAQAKKPGAKQPKKGPTPAVIEEKVEEKKEEEVEIPAEPTEEEMKMENQINNLFDVAQNDLEEEYNPKISEKNQISQLNKMNLGDDFNIPTSNMITDKNNNNISLEMNFQNNQSHQQNNRLLNTNRSRSKQINSNSNSYNGGQREEEGMIDNTFNNEESKNMEYNNQEYEINENDNKNQKEELNESKQEYQLSQEKGIPQIDNRNIQNEEEENNNNEILSHKNKSGINSQREESKILNSNVINNQVDEENQIITEPIEDISTMPNKEYEKLIINENDDFMKHSIDAKKNEEEYLFDREKWFNNFRNLPGVYRDKNIIHPIQEHLRKAERSKVYPFLPKDVSIPIYEKFELIHKFEEEMIDEFPLRETQLNFGDRIYQENLNKDILSQKIAKLLMLDPEIKTYYNKNADNTLLMLYYNIPESRVYRKLKTGKYLTKPDFENWVNYFQPVFEKKQLEKKLEMEVENQMNDENNGENGNNPQNSNNNAQNANNNQLNANTNQQNQPEKNNQNEAANKAQNPHVNEENPANLEQAEPENKENSDADLLKQKLKEQTKLFAELEKSLDSKRMYIANDSLLGQIKEKIKYMFPSDNGIFIKKIIEHGLFNSFSTYVYKDDMIFGIRNLKCDQKSITCSKEFWYKYDNDTNLTINYLLSNPDYQEKKQGNNLEIINEVHNQNDENNNENGLNIDNNEIKKDNYIGITYITFSLKNGLNIQILPNGEIAQKLINSNEYRIVNSLATVIRCFEDGKRYILYSNGNFCTVENNKAININNRGMKIERDLQNGNVKELEQIPITIQTDTDSKTKTLIREDGVLLIKYQDGTSLTIHKDDTKIYQFKKDENENIHYVIEHNSYATIDVYVIGQNKIIENNQILNELASQCYDNIIYHISLPDGNNVYIIRKKYTTIVKEKVNKIESQEGVDEHKEEILSNKIQSPKSNKGNSKANSPTNAGIIDNKNSDEPQYIEKEVEEIKTLVYIFNIDGGMFKILPGDVEIISSSEKRNLENNGLLKQQLDIDDPYSRKGGIYTCELPSGKIYTIDNEHNKFEIFDDGYANCELFKTKEEEKNDPKTENEIMSKKESIQIINQNIDEKKENSNNNEQPKAVSTPKKEQIPKEQQQSPKENQQQPQISSIEDSQKKVITPKKKKEDIQIEEEEKITYDQKGRPCSPSYEKIALNQIEERKKREEEKKVKKELEEKIAKEKAAEAERAKKPGVKAATNKNAVTKKGKDLKNFSKKASVVSGKDKKGIIIEQPEEEESEEDLLPPTPPTKNFIHPRLFVIENDASGYELLNEEQITTFKEIKKIDENHVKYLNEKLNNDYISHYYITKYISIDGGILETHKINQIQLPMKLVNFAKIPRDPKYPYNEFYFYRNFIESTKKFNETIPDELLYEPEKTEEINPLEEEKENIGGVDEIKKKKKKRKKKENAPKTFREKVQEAKEKSNEYFESRKAQWFFGSYMDVNNTDPGKEKEKQEFTNYRKYTKEMLEKRQELDMKFDYDEIRKKININKGYIQILHNKSILFDIEDYVNKEESKKIREDLSFRIYPLNLIDVPQTEKLTVINEYDNLNKNNDSMSASMVSRKKHLIEGQNKEPKFIPNYFDSDKGKDYRDKNKNNNEAYNSKKERDDQGNKEKINNINNQEFELNLVKNEEEKKNSEKNGNNTNNNEILNNNEYCNGDNQNNINLDNNFDTNNKKNSPVVLINGENDDFNKISNINNYPLSQTKIRKKQLPSIHKQTQILNKINEEYNAQKAREWVESKQRKYTVDGELRKLNPKVPHYLYPTNPQADYNEDYIYIEKLTEKRVKTSSVANRIYFNAPSVEEIRRSGQHDLLLEAMEKRRTPEEMMERLNLMITSELCDPLNRQLKIDPVELNFGKVCKNKDYQMYFKLRNDDNMTNRVSIRKQINKNSNIVIENFLGGKVVPGETKRVKVVLKTADLNEGDFNDIVEVHTKTYIYKIPIIAYIVEESKFDKVNCRKEGRYEYKKCYPVADDKFKGDIVKLVLPKLSELEQQKKSKKEINTNTNNDNNNINDDNNDGHDDTNDNN